MSGGCKVLRGYRIRDFPVVFSYLLINNVKTDVRIKTSGAELGNIQLLTNLICIINSSATYCQDP